MEKARSSYAAAGLSLLLPGLGQLYNGERPKGIAILFIAAGTLGGILLSSMGPVAFKSRLSTLMLGIVYFFVWIPAVMDAYQGARGTSAALLSGEKPWFVILMLISVGPMALPLLWYSQRFSRLAKVIWTAVVILAAIVGILLILFVGPLVERWLQELSTLP